MWAYATIGREPGAGLMGVLEGRAEALVGSFDAQAVANGRMRGWGGSSLSLSLSLSRNAPLNA